MPPGIAIVTANSPRVVTGARWCVDRPTPTGRRRHTGTDCGATASAGRVGARAVGPVAAGAPDMQPRGRSRSLDTAALAETRPLLAPDAGPPCSDIRDLSLGSATGSARGTAPRPPDAVPATHAGDAASESPSAAPCGTEPASGAAAVGVSRLDITAVATAPLAVLPLFNLRSMSGLASPSSASAALHHQSYSAFESVRGAVGACASPSPRSTAQPAADSTNGRPGSADDDGCGEMNDAAPPALPAWPVHTRARQASISSIDSIGSEFAETTARPGLCDIECGLIKACIVFGFDGHSELQSLHADDADGALAHDPFGDARIAGGLRKRKSKAVLRPPPPTMSAPADLFSTPFQAGTIACFTDSSMGTVECLLQQQLSAECAECGAADALWSAAPDGCTTMAEYGKFCFPDGAQFRQGPADLEPRVHSFTVTDAHGIQSFGTCLTLYVPLTMRDSSMQPRRSDDALPASSSPVAAVPDDSWLSVMCQIEQFLRRTIPGSADKPTDALLEPLGTVYLPVSICLLSAYQYFGLFKDCFAAALTALVSAATSLDVGRLRRQVCLFASSLMNVPVPPQGPVQVQFTPYGAAEGTQLVCRPLWDGRARIVDGSLWALFTAIGRRNVLNVVAGLLTEQRIILLSRDYALLTVMCEDLLSLLWPFRWIGVYIPLLPDFDLDFFDAIGAPSLFIIGAHRRHKSQALSQPDLLVIDLDFQEVIYTAAPEAASSAVPPLPKEACDILEKWLRELPLHHDMEMMHMPVLANLSCRTGACAHAATLACRSRFERGIRVAFRQAMLAMFGDFRRYLKFNSNTLDAIAFLESRRADDRAFYNAVLKTQMFNFLLQELNSPPLEYFDEMHHSYVNEQRRQQQSQQMPQPASCDGAMRVNADVWPQSRGSDVLRPTGEPPLLDAELSPVPIIVDLPALDSAWRANDGEDVHADASSPSSDRGRACDHAARAPHEHRCRYFEQAISHLTALIERHADAPSHMPRAQLYVLRSIMRAGNGEWLSALADIDSVWHYDTSLLPYDLARRLLDALMPIGGPAVPSMLLDGRYALMERIRGYLARTRHGSHTSVSLPPRLSRTRTLSPDRVSRRSSSASLAGMSAAALEAIVRSDVRGAQASLLHSENVTAASVSRSVPELPRIVTGPQDTLRILQSRPFVDVSLFIRCAVLLRLTPYVSVAQRLHKVLCDIGRHSRPFAARSGVAQTGMLPTQVFLQFYEAWAKQEQKLAATDLDLEDCEDVVTMCQIVRVQNTIGSLVLTSHRILLLPSGGSAAREIVRLERIRLAEKYIHRRGVPRGVKAIRISPYPTQAAATSASGSSDRPLTAPFSVLFFNGREHFFDMLYEMVSGHQRTRLLKCPSLVTEAANNAILACALSPHHSRFKQQLLAMSRPMPSSSGCVHGMRCGMRRPPVRDA